MEAGDYNLTIYVIRGDFLVDVDEKLGTSLIYPTILRLGENGSFCKTHSWQIGV